MKEPTNRDARETAEKFVDSYIDSIDADGLDEYEKLVDAFLAGFAAGQASRTPPLTAEALDRHRREMKEGKP